VKEIFIGADLVKVDSEVYEENVLILGFAPIEVTPAREVRVTLRNDSPQEISAAAIFRGVVEEL